MRYRARIGAGDMRIFDDVHVKFGAHAITADRSITEQATDAEWFDAAVADGAIIGQWLKRDGRWWNPVDPARVETLMAAVAGVRERSRRSQTGAADVSPAVTACNGGSAARCTLPWRGGAARFVEQASPEISVVMQITAPACGLWYSMPIGAIQFLVQTAPIFNRQRLHCRHKRDGPFSLNFSQVRTVSNQRRLHMASADIWGNLSQYFFQGPDAITVDPGVIISGTPPDSTAVSDTYFSGAQLYNYGNIAAGQGNIGVNFTQDFCLIVNEALGSISGQWAVDVNGVADTVKNFGTINGMDTGVWFWGFSAATLDNNGVVGGGFAGVISTSTIAGGTIHNNGEIVGGTSTYAGNGVYIETATGLTTSITNAVNALIDGTGHGIEINVGAISLNNHGTITRGINDDANGNNVIVNDGAIRGGIKFGGGVDVYNGSGGGTVDHIACGSGTDLIVLGKGSTIVLLGDGNDVVTAGSGRDSFWFSSHDHVDHINNYNSDLDHIVLSQSAFAGITSNLGSLSAADFHVGSHATTWSQHIVYNPHNGFLYYDVYGNASAHQAHFATVAPHLALTAADFLVTA
jgi:hypothetical protein